jgi:hypothetical protein
MSPPLLRNIIQALDDRILADPSIGPSLFTHLRAQQRKLGLLHGDRPTCPFLRPLILSRAQYEAIASAARTIAEAFERLVEQALKDKTLLAELGLTATEEKMARIDPGYARLCVTSRLDAYLSDSGFHFLEYNAENPAGIGDQMQLEKVLFEVPPVTNFLDEYHCWLPQPHRLLLAALRRTYREWGGDEVSPQIAIGDWDGVATASEFTVLKEYFESEGTATIIADPGALEFDGDVLRVRDFRIDIVYKRVIIHEFLERCDEQHPLARAYARRKVCMCNSFRSKVAHKKAGFAILSDPQYADLFSAEQLEVIRKHIPWTRLVRRGPTTFEGAKHDLVELLREARERLVLKPNDEYGGSGIFLGWETSAADWEQAIDVALERPYVVQQRVPVEKTLFPMFGGDDGAATATPLIVDVNPFLFDNQVEGALVRLSATSLSNISSGGGQTALLVLED